MTDEAYRKTIEWLYALDRGLRPDLKLGRMRRALSLLGSPDEGLAIVQIGGTNGKGSTAAILDSILRCGGYRVGLFTSPHLVDFTERIRIGGRTIPRAEVVERVAAVRRLLAAAGIELTFFEIVTIVALDAFARHRVDLAILEVGLGGRLDATSVTTPVAVAITGVAADHQALLGETLLEIAREKAGILKAGVPAVVGAVAGDVGHVIRERAADVGAPVLAFGQEYHFDHDADSFDLVCRERRWRGLDVSLKGRFQRGNAAVAVMLSECLRRTHPVSDGALRAGLAQVRWPGRLDVVSRDPLIVLDGAHNAEAAEAVYAEMITVARSRPICLVFAATLEKDWPAVWRHLRPLAREVIVTRAGSARGVDPATIVRELGAEVRARAIESCEESFELAVRSAGPTGAVLVAGSLHLVGDVYRFLLQTSGGRHLFEAWNGDSAGATHARG